MSSNRYLELDFTLDEQELTQLGYDHLEAQFPEWEPADGNIETHIIELVAMVAAERAEVAALVPLGIFRYFGQVLLDIPTLEGEYATVTSTWTAIDTEGHTIPAGTVVDIDGEPFTVISEAVIDPGVGSTDAGGVFLQALDVGVEANNLGVDVTSIDALYWIDTITAVELTAGGVDPETDDEYLDRLTEELQLLTPRPILPNDFAVLAKKANGTVARAVGVDLYNPGTNEVISIGKTGTPTSGTFTLTYSGQTTAAIDWDATAAEVQTALRALSNIGPEDIDCANGPLPDTNVRIEFVNALAATNVSLTITDSVTGGDIVITGINIAGVAAVTDEERYVSVAVTDVDGERISDAIKTEIQEYVDALREVNFVVKIIDPTYTTIDVTADITRMSDFDADAVQASIEAALAEFLAPTSWGRSFTGEEDLWYNTTKVSWLSVGEVIKRTEGVLFVNTLTVNGGTSDITLTGAAPLTRPGTMTVTVAN